MVERLIRYKVYLERTRVYMGLFQFLLIGIIFIKDFDVKIKWWMYPIIVIVFLVVSIVFGYFENKMGFRGEEFRYNTKSNPFMIDMLKKIEDINKKINENTTNN